MYIFLFDVNSESEAFCLKIVSEMIKHFAITQEEAIARINQQWLNISFLEADDIRYHEDETFWAFDIYYGADSKWWDKPLELKPRLYRRSL